MIRLTLLIILVCFGQTQALDVSSRERLGSSGDDDDKALVVCNANPMIGGEETKKAARWNLVSPLSDYCIGEQSLEESEEPYDTAEDFCTAIGGSLPVMTNIEQAKIQLNFVRQHSVLTNSFWAGLRRKDGRLIAGNGYRAGSFRDWVAGQSDASLTEGRECAVMKMIDDGKWRADDCDKSIKFYCVAPKGKFPMMMVIIFAVVFLVGLLSCCLACFCCCGTAIVVSLRTCFGKYERHPGVLVIA